MEQAKAIRKQKAYREIADRQFNDVLSALLSVSNVPLDAVNHLSATPRLSKQQLRTSADRHQRPTTIREELLIDSDEEFSDNESHDSDSRFL